MKKNKILWTLVRRLTTLYYKKTHFWVTGWRVDSATSIHIISEEETPDYHRKGVKKVLHTELTKGQDTIDWIPVTKRLPACDGWYQCTAKATETQLLVVDMYFRDGKWLDNRRINMFEVYQIYGYGKSGQFHRMTRDEFDEFDWTDAVTAWRELPEPYRKE